MALVGGDRLDLVQDPAQRGALPDDVLEVMSGADLLFEVDLLLRELVLEGCDLAIRQRVLDRHGHLVGDPCQEFQVVGTEGHLRPSGEAQDAEDVIPAHERQDAHGLDALGQGPVALRQAGLRHVADVARPRLACAEDPARDVPLQRNQVLVDESFASREIEREESQPAALGIR